MRFVEDASADAFEHHNGPGEKHYLEDPGALPREAGVESVGRGAGAVLDLDDGLTAVYRDDEGEVHRVSAFRTHMGRLVHWNDGERSRDCPCHGSRFAHDGTVLDGRANSPLSERDGE